MKRLFVVIALLAFTVGLFVSCSDKTNKPINTFFEVNGKQGDSQTEKDSLPATEDTGVQNVDKIDVTLYFSDSNAVYLYPEVRSVEVAGNIYVSVLSELRKGPKTPELYPTLSGEYKINSAILENGVCTVDFSNEFVTYNTGGSTKEMLALRSVTNSLCALEGVDCVKINIDGDTSAEFGHGFLDAVFYPNYETVNN